MQVAPATPPPGLLTNPEPAFTLNQPSPNHHNMTLRSQTTAPSSLPHLIPPDDNTQQYTTPYEPPSKGPHIIPPDYAPTINIATNFKKLAIDQLIANHVFNSPTVHHVFNELTGERETMDTLLQGIDGINWSQALCNEWDRLAEGRLGTVKGTCTIEFIHPSELPNGHKVTYGSFVCDHKPLKPEPQRVCLTVGGDKLDYPFDTSSPASSLIEAKLMLNSTISDTHKGAKFMAADLKDFS
jgi:hypothetical protein